jgi:HTH-type transcriptional regulator/antitoxin HigA
MHAKTLDLAELAPAWAEVQSLAHVKIGVITSERHFRDMVKLMNGLLDEIGDRENHPLMGLLDVVTTFVENHEQQQGSVPDASPVEVLRFLMDQHALKQVDLAGLFGAQSNVSEVLSGKREINARQARALATRFGVSPEVFI